jgi:excisionase family DNA binding protein
MQRSSGSANESALGEETAGLTRLLSSESKTGSDPLFWSVAETARALRVSDDAIYELLQRGELPCLRIGRRRVIPRRAVELVVERLLADFDPSQLTLNLTVPEK